MIVWRLANSHRPCDYIRHNLSSWRNRFDDTEKTYRTIYGARLAITCLRELLADLRPNEKAISEFEGLFGGDPGGGLIVAGVVSLDWRRANVLVEAVPELGKRRLVTIEAPFQRKRLAEQHKTLLKSFGISSLDVAALRTRERPVTRAFSRTLFNEGYAGITFHSRLDGKPCYAFFEGRAVLRQKGAAVPMTENHPDLIKVCGEYTLVLRS